jgi:hypothetical protein
MCYLGVFYRILLYFHLFMSIIVCILHKINNQIFYIMSLLQSHFSQFSAFGVSGSRSVIPSFYMHVISYIPQGSPVFVGCAAGVDDVTRSYFSHSTVFRASQFPASSFSASLALRSMACVRAVGAVGGLWLSFPSVFCPSALVPCRSPFSGSGSGSWASLAYAVFMRVHCVICLPPSVFFPSSWLSYCTVTPLGVSPCGSSFFALSPLPVSQSSLF